MTVSEDPLGAQLQRWREVGLLTADQASRIVTFERRRPTSPPPADAGRRTRVAEAVGYVGAALALGALGVLLGDLWDALTTGGQLSLVVLLTAVAAAAALALAGTASAAMQRLTSVLAVAAVIGVGWTTVIAAGSVAGWPDREVAVAVGVATVLAAALAYVPRPRPLPQIALLLTLTWLIEAWLYRSGLTAEAFWYALPAVALGVAWVVLAIGGWLRPAATATTAGAALALIALQCVAYGRFGTLALAMGSAIAVVAVVAAVVGGGTHHLAVGSLGLFVLLPQLVIDLFGDAIGAPATVLVVGLLLVLLSVGLGRAKRELRMVEREVGT